MKGSPFLAEQTGSETESTLITGSGEPQLHAVMLGLTSSVSIGSEHDSRGRILTGLVM